MTTMIGFGQSRPCAGPLLPYNSWFPGKVLTPGEKSGALLERNWKDRGEGCVYHEQLNTERKNNDFSGLEHFYFLYDLFFTLDRIFNRIFSLYPQIVAEVLFELGTNRTLNTVESWVCSFNIYAFNSLEQTPEFHKKVICDFSKVQN